MLRIIFNYWPLHERNVEEKKINKEVVLGSGGIAPPFLASALGRGKWSASCSTRFNPREKASGTHCIGGWVGPRTGLDAVE
jgi:hypothetical protein